MHNDLRHRQMNKQAELRSQYKAYMVRDHYGGGSSSYTREKERRRGYYVRKPRPEQDVHRSARSPPRNDNVDRKRRPKQHWVVRGDSVRQVGNDTFIRDTRQKTSSMFDHISEQHDESADPARQGRRSQ